MLRIDSPNSVGGRFTAGDGTAGRSATQFTPEWCNGLQEEIASVIEA